MSWTTDAKAKDIHDFMVILRMGHAFKENICLLTALVVVLLLSSCVLFNPEKAMILPQSDQEFKEAIDWYDNILRDEQASLNDKSRAHLRLGLLYSHYRNPDLDYDLALQHVETSIGMLNGAAPDDNVMNLRSLLSSITGFDISKLPALYKLKTENTALANENLELRKTLEKLNDLEVELEKKRKLIR